MDGVAKMTHPEPKKGKKKSVDGTKPPSGKKSKTAKANAPAHAFEEEEK